MAPHLVGRAGELDALDAARRRLAEGVGGFVCIVGEAGIGKTSLLSAARADLQAQGVGLAAATADETDRRRSLAVVRSLLPEVGAARTADPVDDAVAAVERLAGAGPAALLADDLHWADDASLDALRAIGRRAEGLGVLLAVTTRAQPASPGLRRLVELAESVGVCLHPDPLDAAGLAALVAGRLGAGPGARLAGLLEATAGNPFLAVELVESLVEDAQLTVDGDLAEVDDGAQLPGGLSRRLATRALAAVPDGELVLPATAAVPGGATAEELAALLDVPLPDVLAATLTAVEAGVLVDAGVALEFRHDLLRRAVLDATPASIVRTLSRRATDVLRERRADPERVTACLLACADPDDASDRDLLLAVSREYRDDHPEDAADLLARALAGMPRTDRRVPEAVLDLGWALVAAGRAAEVEPLLADHHGPFRDDDPLPVHRLRTTAARLTGRLDLLADWYAHIDAARVAELYHADDVEAVDVIAELALLRVSAARLDEAGTILDWVDASPSPVSPYRTATVETVRSWLAVTTGRLEDAAAHARAAQACIERDGTGRSSLLTPTLPLAAALDMLGDSDGALAAARRQAAEPLPRWRPPLLQFYAAFVLYNRGDWDDALAEVDAALQAAEDADMGMAVFWPYAVSTVIAWARGDLGQARRLIDDAAASGASPALGGEWLMYGAAMVATADGDIVRAVQTIELVVAGLEVAGAPALLLHGGPDMMRVSLDGGRPDLAERIAAALAEVRARTASPVVAALAAWSDGLVRGDVGAIETAADELLSVGRAPEAARAGHEAAVRLARAGDLASARRMAKRAFAAYETLGAELWRRQLRSHLRSAGLDVRPPRRPRRATSGWTSLTASEETIVSLVGDGLTNTEIADRLFVSRRTVESHLGRVYAKLGLSSRAQLVAGAVNRRHHGG